MWGLLRHEAEEEEGQVREGPTGLAKMYVFNSQGVKDLAGGAVDKNPPANAGDTGLIPGLGRFHMPAEQPSPVHLNYRSLRDLEPAFRQLLKPVVP